MPFKLVTKRESYIEFAAVPKVAAAGESSAHGLEGLLVRGRLDAPGQAYGRVSHVLESALIIAMSLTHEAVAGRANFLSVKLGHG